MDFNVGNINNKVNIQNNTTSVKDVDDKAFDNSIWKFSSVNNSEASFKKSNSENIIATPKSFDDVKAYYEEGHNAEETYAYFKEGLSSNKNNPEVIKNIVDGMLGVGGDKYDYNVPYAKIADKNPEILEKFITAENSVDNAICATIHGFMMEALNESGISAALLSGKQRGGGHATLIYQAEDGKYIWNNYGKNVEFEADNVVDAAKMINKSGAIFQSKGYVIITGTGKNFYQEYEYEKEAAFGKEIENSKIDKENAFSTAKVQNKSSLQGSYEMDSVGSGTNVEAVIVSNSKKSHLGISGEYRENGESASFNNSRSLGAKLSYVEEFKLNEDNRVNLQGGVIYNRIDGNETDKEITNRAIKADLDLSYEKDLYKSKDSKLTSGTKVSEDLSFNLGQFSMDSRTLLQSGLSGEAKLGEDFTLGAEMSAGVLMNSARLDYRSQVWGVDMGAKYNTGSSIAYSPTDKIKVKLTESSFAAKLRNSDHSGQSLGAEVNYQPNKDLDITVGAKVDTETKNLKIGGFDEDLIDETTLTGYANVEVNKKLSLFGSFSHEFKEKDNTVKAGIKYNF